MQMSARVLGQEYGLTAEEMNRILCKLGFLQGTPGEYSLTDKAIKYAVEKDYHRGTGGYSIYNRYWSTRTFDDSIKDALDVSTDLIRETREELAVAHAARHSAQAAASAKASADFLVTQAAEEAAAKATEKAAQDAEALMAKWKKVGTAGLIVGGVIIVGYRIYKITPKVKAWWIKRHGDPEAFEDEIA